MKRSKQFYNDRRYVEKVTATSEERSVAGYENWIDKGLIVELGCGAGGNSQLADSYVGIDLSETALMMAKEGMRICADISAIPLSDSIADAILSIATLEHVPNPQKVLEECIRVLKPGGVVVHDDAWFCRPWTSTGITVKPWKDCSLGEKLLKLSIFLRDARIIRASHVLPLRIAREQRMGSKRAEFRMDFRRLEPNLENPLTSDSDAFVSIDPHAVALFYKSRGFELIRPEDSILSRLVHTGHVICRKSEA